MALGFFEFALGAVIAGSIAGVVQQSIKLEREKERSKRAGLGGEASQLREVVGDLHQDVAKLKERVRVLEKLVTDDDRRLADEIERLRRADTGARP